MTSTMKMIASNIIDESLSSDLPRMCPIEELLATNDLEQDFSSLSSDDENDDTTPPQQQDSRPRSIFQSYWKNDGTPDKPIRIQRSPSPKCVLRDPYRELGLLDDEEEEEHLINTYERTLRHIEVVDTTYRRRPYQSRPLWMEWFANSAPSLRLSLNNNAFFRQTKSDTALHQTTAKSALRKGRFGGGKPSTRACGHVKFQPVVHVHPFEPPVESWAPDGWSNWFE